MRRGDKLRTRLKYSEEFAKEAFKLAEKGFMDKEIAEYLGININTFYKWKAKHKEFAEGLIKAKYKVNNKIEAQVLKRALGYMVVEEKNTFEPDENGDEILIKRETHKKHIAGDSKLLMMLLKNRMPEKYRDAQKQEIELSGQIDNNIKNPLQELSVEELKKLINS